MTEAAHPLNEPIDRNVAFARWERRRVLIRRLRLALPALMGVISLGLVGWVSASALRTPKLPKIDDPVIVMRGARGVASAPDLLERRTTFGMLSWRRINNYQELHRASAD